MKKILFILCSAAATLVACNKAEVVTPVANDDARVVKFETKNLYSFDTKAGEAIDASKSVAIYADNLESASNVAYTVGTMPNADPTTNGTLTGTSIKWGITQMGTTNNTKFFAMYPHASSTERDNFSTSTDLAYNINDEEYAKYFLVDVVDQNPGSDVENPNAVVFNLKHPFALLRYVITNTSDDAIRKVEIAGVHKTGNLAYNTGVITASGDVATAAELALESTAGNVLTYYSVIVPENGINPTITITTWTGATSSFSLSASQNFVAGKQYTASITYNHTHLVQTSNTTVSAQFTVADWDAQNVTAGDEASYTSSTTDWPILKGTGFGSTWESGIRMPCVGQNSYRLVITKSGDVAFKVYMENGTWYGSSSSITVDSWTKVTTSTDGGAANISLTSDNGTYTVYYYSDSHEVWIKSGDVTR